MKSHWVSALLVLGLQSLFGAAAAEDKSSCNFAVSDLFYLEAASDPQISPDGSRIAYVRRSGDIMVDQMRPSLWLIDTRSGEQTPLATGSAAVQKPRWSPDGKRIAYIAKSESGLSQLFVRWLALGESVRITGLPDSPGNIAWSPDGRQIAYTMRVPGEALKLGTLPAKPEGAQWAAPLEIHSAVTWRTDESAYLKPGYSHIFVVGADGGAPRKLTSDSFNHSSALSWTPDGQGIVFSANLKPNWEREQLDTEIYYLNIAGDKSKALTDRNGPDEEPSVSPDGKLIAYIGFDDRQLGYQNRILYVMNLDKSERRALTKATDRSVGSPQWSADSRSIFVTIDDKASRRVVQVGLDGELQTIAEGLAGNGLDRPYLGGSFSVARNGAVAFTNGDSGRPPDVALAQGGKTSLLTHLNQGLFAGKCLAGVRKLPVKASDGRPIDAWLTLPSDYRPGKKLALILEIHGGPFAAYGPFFSTDNQLYAAAGFGVLSVNPRGSTSYGEEFANLIHLAYPGEDYDDLMAAVDSAIAAGFADPDKLFVTGGSGGGVLTAWIVGKTHRFKAAATQKPVIDWASFALTADFAQYFSRYWFGQYPWEDHAAFWARSPLSLVGNVDTPTLVVVGSDDFRTPVSEAEQFYNALQIRGVPTALVKVPGANHDNLAARPSQSAAKAMAIITWFEKYKSGAPQTNK